MPNPDPLPLTSPLRTHPKRLLPASLASTSAHGHLSGHPRSPTAQVALDQRVQEILGTMTRKEMERAYEERARDIRGLVEGIEKGRKEVESEMEKLRMEREMERRVWGKLRGERG